MKYLLLVLALITHSVQANTPKYMAPMPEQDSLQGYCTKTGMLFVWMYTGHQVGATPAEAYAYLFENLNEKDPAYYVLKDMSFPDFTDKYRWIAETWDPIAKGGYYTKDQMLQVVQSGAEIVCLRTTIDYLVKHAAKNSRI